MRRVAGAGVAEWRAHVYAFRCKDFTNGTRVLLLYLADNMRADRTVSVPQTKIAKALNVSVTSVRDRIKDAHDFGLLSTVQAGRPGRTATYQGLFNPRACAPVPAQRLCTPGCTT